jgi:hypothetical protein
MFNEERGILSRADRLSQGISGPQTIDLLRSVCSFMRPETLVVVTKVVTIGQENGSAGETDFERVREKSAFALGRHGTRGE